MTNHQSTNMEKQQCSEPTVRTNSTNGTHINNDITNDLSETHTNTNTDKINVNHQPANIEKQQCSQATVITITSKLSTHINYEKTENLIQPHINNNTNIINMVEDDRQKLILYQNEKLNK